MKLAARLALQSYTSMEFFFNLALEDLFEIAVEIKEARENGG